MFKQQMRLPILYIPVSWKLHTYLTEAGTVLRFGRYVQTTLE